MLSEKTLSLLPEAGLSASELKLAEDANLDLYRMKGGAVMSRVTCGRCGGSGSYSYCEAHGTRCFECNVGRVGTGLNHIGFVFELPKKTIARFKRARAAERKAEKRHAAAAAEAAELAACGFVSYEAFWYAAAEFAKSLKEAKRLAKLSVMRHLGAVGDKLELEVTVTGYHQFGSQWGTRELVRFADADGNVLIWWTSACPADLAERGAVAKISATVKSHEVWDKTGEPQTVLTRVKVRDLISSPSEAAIAS
jgi:hypothetical protein